MRCQTCNTDTKHGLLCLRCGQQIDLESIAYLEEQLQDIAVPSQEEIVVIEKNFTPEVVGYKVF